jgi:hypothetical protein
VQEVEKISGEGGLLLLLRMKGCFLRLQISDHPGKPFNRNLIANGQEYLPVMLDLFIEFVAPVAHGGTLIGCPDV